MVKLFCSQSKVRLQLFALTAAVFVVFGNSLFNGFVWDDTRIFINQEPYRNFDLKRMLLSRANGLEYLPLRDLSIALDHLFWGLKPFGFHLTNLFIYMLVTLLFFLVLRQLTELLGKIDETAAQAKFLPSGWLPFLAALLFAVHPVNAETVNFITSRNTLLAGLFYLLSLLLFLRHIAKPAWRWYILSLLFFVAALLSKATALALPVAMFFICRLCGAGVKMALKLAIPFAAAACILAALHIRMASESGVMAGSASVSWHYFMDRAGVAIQIPLFYLGKLLYPGGLTIEYQWPPAKGASAAMLSGSILLWLLLIILNRHVSKRVPLWTVALVLFLVNLLPVMNLLPTSPVVADRYAFLPSLGFSLGAALLLTGPFMCRVKLALPSAITVIILFSALSIRQNLVWKSDITLFEHAISHAPAATRLVTDLGRIYFFDYGDYAKAFELFGKAGKIDPSDPSYDYFQGFLCLNLKRDIPCAREHLSRALRKRPDFIEALYYLGAVSELEGDREGAMALYRRAMESRIFDISSLKPKAAERYGHLKSSFR